MTGETNRPLRGVKGMLYEGGIRVPWIVRWPGKVKPGTTNHTPVISMDCYPTLLDAAGLPPTPNHPLDGKSLLPLLTQSPGFERDTLYFHYPNYAFHKQNRLGSAIREGEYKLIKNYDDDSLELYDLRRDVGENHNLAGQSPELAKRLAYKLDQWLRETRERKRGHRATQNGSLCESRLMVVFLVTLKPEIIEQSRKN